MLTIIPLRRRNQLLIKHVETRLSGTSKMRQIKVEITRNNVRNPDHLYYYCTRFVNFFNEYFFNQIKAPSK